MATVQKNLKPAAAGSSIGPTEIAQAILAPLASLKLTVFLLVLAVVVTFIATLDQTSADVYEVKMKHFRNVFVSVPFQTFFVPRWFPEYQNIPGRFFIPSGLSVLVLMMLNLTAAHILRFRLQARGAKLVAGLCVGVLAILLTWAIVFMGKTPEGFRAMPPISYTQMWIAMQLGVLAIAVASAVGWFTMKKERDVERLLLGIAAIACAAVLGLTVWLGEKAFIGDSAMRILWQLAQATIAALVGYLACLLLFKRKAGIVLLHLGIFGLMMNEIFVTVTNDEQRMTIYEGETVSQAVDIRETELAIIDTSDPEYDEVITVPEKMLRSEELISNDDLPFNVKCVKYIPSSNLADIRSPKADNLATKGVGLQVAAVETLSSVGTDSDQTVDFSAAYIAFSKPDGTDLGTYLVGQQLLASSADVITVDGKSYRIALQFKTTYKPYSLTLTDAKRENYPGTGTPRWYSSDVVLNDHENGTKSDQRIWMNNPLRYSDETFYQSGMDTLPNGKTYTVLQIVRNSGWMIPYVCCMLTVVGLLAQFGTSLLAFLEKSRNKANRESNVANSPTITTSTGSKLEWLPAVVLVGFFALWTASQAAKAYTNKVKNEEIRLDLLAQVPITINGRYQPLDSFARNTARQLVKRERVADGNEDPQPAIRWLADTLFETDGYKDYRSIRIEDLNVIGALELPIAQAKDRKKFNYSLAEILKKESKLLKLIPDSNTKDPKTWSEFESRAQAIAMKLQRIFGLKRTINGPFLPEEDILTRINAASKMRLTSPLIPLVVPSENPDEPFQSFSVLQTRAMLAEFAKQYDCDSTRSLAKAIVAKEIVPPLREDAIKARIIEALVSNPEFVEQSTQSNTSPAQLAKMLEKNWDKMPSEIKGKIEKDYKPAFTPLVNALIAQELPNFEAGMEEKLATINGSSGKIETQDNEFIALLTKLQPAYIDNDAATFNSTLEAYLAKVNENAPTEMIPSRLKAEEYYNAFSPFYLASIVYLAAFFAITLGWIGWRDSWNRAAYGLLILGLLIHIYGLVARVYISGRPPVTNLYSSVLFVSAVMVGLMLIIERISKQGIGSLMAGCGAFLALLWAWTMTIVDGDTFTVMVAVLDTQFWLATHVVIISVGYGATFVAGLLGFAYLIASLLSPAMSSKQNRRTMIDVIYGVVCFGLLCSFFGTVLGGLWGDDSWGRFWGWDPKENGALMIVLWNAVVLHARWGGMVRERGLAALAVLGNIVVLWSWKGVNALGVGLHAYSGTEDNTIYKILLIAGLHALVAALVFIPERFWMSYAKDETRISKA
ncbi:MAG: cytochrome c biogenesis protein CcsA [Mariniblastus sp.]